ncbi:MAG: pyridoxal phosphate-dependent aminotransferase [Bdellovibrionota bacterium]
MKKNPFVQQLAPSATLALNQKTKSIQESGVKVFNFTAGEPDFPTPDRICKAAQVAMEKGYTKYTPSSGIAPLRQAIAKKYSTQFNRDYDINEIIVSNGGKQVLFNLFFSFLCPEDEVIIFAPYWVSYKSLVEMCGGKAVVLETQKENGFLPDLNQVEAAITSRTRFVVLNSPSNPTGAVYPKAFLQEFGKLLKRFPDVKVISDDMYEHFVFDQKTFYSIGYDGSLDKDQLILVNGVSKSYSMTGWRIGYALGSKEVISTLSKVQSQSTSNPCSISQWAALEAIEHSSQAEIQGMRDTFETRRNLICNELEPISEVSFYRPEGAFYLFLDCRDFLSKLSRSWSDVDLAEYVLNTQHVAMVPGSAFGAPGFMRLSYGVSEQDIKDGVASLQKALKTL